MRYSCPCSRDCEQRSVRCHGECEDYLKWKGENEAIREERYNQKKVYRDYSAFKESSYKKWAKKHGKRV